jgi:hypothetical protein
MTNKQDNPFGVVAISFGSDDLAGKSDEELKAEIVAKIVEAREEEAK